MFDPEQSEIELYLQLQIWRLCSLRCEGSSSSEAETRIAVNQPGGLLVSEDPSGTESLGWQHYLQSTCMYGMIIDYSLCVLVVTEVRLTSY